MVGRLKEFDVVLLFTATGHYVATPGLCVDRADVPGPGTSSLPSDVTEPLKLSLAPSSKYP